MNKENELRKQIKSYNNKYKVLQKEIPEIDYCNTSDMLETFGKFAETKEQLTQFKSCPERISTFNGFTMFTNENRKFTILVNNNQFNSNKDYIHTVTHEYTHVLDYYKYMKENAIQNFDDMMQTKYGNTIYLWSEYHARLRGTEVYYKEYVFKKLVTGQCQIRNCLNGELKSKLQDIDSELIWFENNKNNFTLPIKDVVTMAMYNLTQHFGRFDAWKQWININNFPNERIIELFSPYIVEYYTLLSKSKDYYHLKINLEDLHNALNKIYEYIKNY